MQDALSAGVDRVRGSQGASRQGFPDRGAASSWLPSGCGFPAEVRTTAKHSQILVPGLRVERGRSTVQLRCSCAKTAAAHAASTRHHSLKEPCARAGRPRALAPRPETAQARLALRHPCSQPEDRRSWRGPTSPACPGHSMGERGSGVRGGARCPARVSTLTPLLTPHTPTLTRHSASCLLAICKGPGAALLSTPPLPLASH